MEAMKKINDLCHIIIGFSFVHAIGNLTDWNDFDTVGKFIAVPILSLFFGLCIGFCIEWIENVVVKSDYDVSDIVRTMFGAFFGGLTSVLFPNLNLFMNITLGISAMLCLVELYFLYKIYKQRK
jgi:hypothetical protein